MGKLFPYGICRICGTDAPTNSISAQLLPAFLVLAENFLNVKIKETDQCSQLVCSSCVKTVKEFAFLTATSKAVQENIRTYHLMQDEEHQAIQFKLEDKDVVYIPETKVNSPPVDLTDRANNTVISASTTSASTASASIAESKVIESSVSKCYMQTKTLTVNRSSLHPLSKADTKQWSRTVPAVVNPAITNPNEGKQSMNLLKAPRSNALRTIQRKAQILQTKPTTKKQNPIDTAKFVGHDHAYGQIYLLTPHDRNGLH